MAENIPQHIYVPDFRDLSVWKKAVQLTDRIYEITDGFPNEENYMMRSQIIRSATSVSANIAEGNSQLYKKKEFSFANNALGSLGETKHWVVMAKRRGYIPQEVHSEILLDIDEVMKMLIGYMKSIKKSLPQ